MFNLYVCWIVGAAFGFFLRNLFVDLELIKDSSKIAMMFVLLGLSLAVIATNLLIGFKIILVRALNDSKIE